MSEKKNFGKPSYGRGHNQGFRFLSVGVKEDKNGNPYLQAILQDSAAKRKFYWSGFLQKGGFVDNKFVEDMSLAKEDNDRLKVDIKALVASVAGVDAVNNAESLNQGAGFRAFLEAMISALPDNYRDIDVDVFLRYQWTVREGQERTFLEIPASSKHGAFICPATTGDYLKIESEEQGMKFINSKNMEPHPFAREAWWVASNFNNATGTVVKAAPQASSPPLPPAPAPPWSGDSPTSDSPIPSDDLPF